MLRLANRISLNAALTWKQDVCVSAAERREDGGPGRVELRGQAAGSERKIKVRDNTEISDWEITSEKHTGGDHSGKSYCEIRPLHLILFY